MFVIMEYEQCFAPFSAIIIFIQFTINPNVKKLRICVCVSVLREIQELKRGEKHGFYIILPLTKTGGFLLL